MSWLRGKKGSVTNLKAEANSNRSTTPTPGNPGGKREKRLFRSGLLTIRVMWAEGLALPQGVPLPRAVQMALTSQQAKVAASVSPSSVTKHRQQTRSRGNRCVHRISTIALFVNYFSSMIGIACRGRNAGGCLILLWNTRLIKCLSRLSVVNWTSHFTCIRHTCERRSRYFVFSNLTTTLATCHVIPRSQSNSTCELKNPKAKEMALQTIWAMIPFSAALNLYQISMPWEIKISGTNWWAARGKPKLVSPISLITANR